MTLEAGTRFGRFTVRAPLGAGGMGEVYRARDERLDRDVALKVLPEALAGDADRVHRFEREARATAALDHPNVLAVHDVGTHDGRPYIVTELLEGDSLRSRIEAGDLTHGKAVEIGLQIARGLAAAHEHDIVHRDLKPENVFVCRDGIVKILDFGLAKLVAPDRPTGEGSELQTASVPTAAGTLLGTAGYMAPEQVRGESADARSDVFALGCILHEMLSGRRAFHRATTAETLAAILREEPPSLASGAPALPASLARVVARCLEKRPDDRFQTARDVAFALQAACGESIEAAAAGGRGGRTGRLLTAGVAVAAVAAIAALLLLHPRPVGEREGRLPPRIVVLPFENLGASGDEFFADGVTEEITSRLASVGGLRVVSRTSAMHYKNAGVPLHTIAGELGVEYALEGTVRWDRATVGSGRVRITPQLIRVADDSHLWSDRYDRTIDDIFAVQTEIAQRVVEKLGIALLSHEKAIVEEQPTRNLEAYEAYLLGRHYERQPHFTYEVWLKMMASYERAAELDPDFALVRAELAAAHAGLVFFWEDASPARLAMARTAAERAIALAPVSPRVHLALSYYYLYAFRDPVRATEELAVAERGLPGSAEVLQAKAAIFELEGRFEEGIEALVAAEKLSPLDAAAPMEVGFFYWVLHRYSEGVAAFDRSATLAPDSYWPALGKTFIGWSSGDPGAARRALETLPRSTADWLRWSRFWQSMYEGRYEEAIAEVSSPADGWIHTKMWARPNALFAAQAYQASGDERRALDAWRRAAALLEPEVRAQPGDPRYHSSLGIAYAALGRGEEALREGKLAADILPVSRDAFYGLPYVLDLAHIGCLVGEREAALEQLERLLAAPSWVTPAFLRFDPRWRPLRADPRFSALLARYSSPT